jgi:hypothetical protein
MALTGGENAQKKAFRILLCPPTMHYPFQSVVGFVR